jgi:hypothetical protein
MKTRIALLSGNDNESFEPEISATPAPISRIRRIYTHRPFG